MFRIILKNIVANWVGFALQIAVSFFLTPFILHSLGDARYGAWALLTGLTGYYGFLDLGFRAGLTQFTTRYLAIKDYEKLNATSSTGVVALGLIGLVLVLVSALLAVVAPWAFHFPAHSIFEVRWSIFIVGIGVAMQFPFFVFSSVLPAAQRYDIANAIGITTRLVSAALTVVTLAAGYGLVGISIATVGANLLDYLLRWQAAHRIIPQMAISFRKANLASAWEFTNFGLWNVFISSSRRVLQFTDIVLVGIFMPAAAIAPYALAAGVANYLTSMIRPITTVFFPAATELDARGDTRTLRNVYLTASRLVFSFAVAGGLIGAFWADEFFRLWLGEKYVSSNVYGSVATLYRYLVAAAVITNGQRIGYQVLLGSLRLKPLAGVFVAEAIANMALCLCLIPWLGLKGAVLANVIPALICQGVLQPTIACRRVRVPLWKHALHVYARPLIFGLSMAAIFTEMKQLLPLAHSWSMLTAQGLAAILLLLPVWLAIVLGNEERERLILGPLRRAERRLSFLFRHRPKHDRTSAPQVHESE